MRLWIVNHHALPPGAAGGTRAAVLAKYLSRLGHEVTVFCSFSHHAKATVIVPAGATHVDREYDGVRFRFVATAPYRTVAGRFLNMRDFRRAALRADGHLAPPDVVIGSSVHLHAADAGRILARRHRVPFVFEVRDVWPQTLVDMGAMSPANPVFLYLRALERRLYRAAATVITLLPGSLPYLEANGVPAQRVCYVPNGVDPDLLPSEVPARASGPFTVTYFGAHGRANDLHTALRAARGLPDVRFLFVGEGTERERLRGDAAAWGLRNVEFREAIPKERLHEVVAESDAFLLLLRDLPVLRRYGVSPNKLFDYLLAGRPVVFAVASFNNPVEEAGAGITVPPESPVALAEGIRALWQAEPQERAAMGRRGRAWVVENHNLKTLAGKLAAHLEGVVADAAAGAR